MVLIFVVIFVGIVVFWMVLYVFFGKKEIDFEIGEFIEKEEGFSVDMFIVMWRIKCFLGFIDRVLCINLCFWKVYVDVGIVFGYMGMVYVFYVFVKIVV